MAHYSSPKNMSWQQEKDLQQIAVVYIGQEVLKV